MKKLPSWQFLSVFHWFFKHANTCACMHLLVQIHNSSLTFLFCVYSLFCQFLENQLTLNFAVVQFRYHYFEINFELQVQRQIIKLFALGASLILLILARPYGRRSPLNWQIKQFCFNILVFLFRTLFVIWYLDWISRFVLLIEACKPNTLKCRWTAHRGKPKRTAHRPWAVWRSQGGPDGPAA